MTNNAQLHSVYYITLRLAVHELYVYIETLTSHWIQMSLVRYSSCTIVTNDLTTSYKNKQKYTKL